jgi:hypothetical protein
MKKIIKKQLDKIFDYFGYVDKDLVQFSKTMKQPVIIEQQKQVIILTNEKQISQLQLINIRDFKEFESRLIDEMIYEFKNDLINSSKISTMEIPPHMGGGVKVGIKIFVVNQN